MTHKSQTESRQPHPVDVAAGHQLRLLRLRAGLTQSELGAAVGVTFQQVQKYERGTNRISLSRAVEFASVLRFNVAELILGQDPIIPVREDRLLTKWMTIYSRARDSGIEKRLLNIAEEIVELGQIVISK